METEFGSLKVSASFLNLAYNERHRMAYSGMEDESNGLVIIESRYLQKCIWNFFEDMKLANDNSNVVEPTTTTVASVIVWETID